jgi:hypothetical protein
MRGHFYAGVELFRLAIVWQMLNSEAFLQSLSYGIRFGAAVILATIVTGLAFVIMKIESVWPEDRFSHLD